MNETRTYKIMGSKEVLNRFEGLLNLFHWASAFGHSGKFGMPLDGDGDGAFEIESPRDRQGCDKIFGVGYDVELSYDKTFSGIFADRRRTPDWAYDRDTEPTKEINREDVLELLADALECIEQYAPGSEVLIERLTAEVERQ